MDLTWSAEDFRFRDEVRAFLDENLTPDLKDAVARMTSVYAPPHISRIWLERLNARGWAAPNWPVEYGGCGWSITQRFIFARELAAAGAPPLSPMGIGMCAPAIIGFGSPEQKAFYLPRMLTGEDFWCQGYSEPNSGSDLASLQMRAVEDGDELVCTGAKIWTTHAQYANRIFCLVRTASEGRPQLGISFALIDMNQPGVKVQPIVMLSGEHIQNVVFFDEVRVPKLDVLGGIGQGWAVAKYLLEFERGAGVATPGLRARLDRIEAVAHAEGAADAAFLAKLAAARIQIDAFEGVELRHLARLVEGHSPGPNASMMKIVATELSQRLTELALEAAAHYPAAWQAHATCPGGPTPFYPEPAEQGHVGPLYATTIVPKYLNDRAGSIYGGSNEIQRNIMAKNLGL